MQPVSPVRRVAVIGAGLAGRSFALRCVTAGYAVALEDVMPEKLRRAQDAYAEVAAVDATGSLRLATEVEDAVCDADLAIDFVPDELESKLEIFSLLDRMAPPRTILLTPTETLSITDLASCTYRAELCVGLRGALAAGNVTLVQGLRSTSAAVESAQDLLRRLGLQVGSEFDTVETNLTRNLR